MNENKYYKLLDSFAVRVPAFPSNYYKKIKDENFIEDIIKNKYFQEAIKIASPSLYNSMNKGKLNDSVIKAIIKYYSRITNRTTPFGLFSGISIGQFNENTLVNYDEDNFNKRLRVDYEWIVKLIKKIEIEFKGYRNFTLYTSRNIIEYGDKIENPVITCFNFYKNNESYKGKCYINNKPNIRFVLKMFEKGAKYNDIIDEFNKRNIKVSDLVLDKLIEGLIKNEYVYTEVRPAINESDSLSYIINKIKSSKLEVNILEDIEKINLLIKNYNKLQKEDGTTILNEIQNLMMNIVESRSYIQVDSVNSFKVELGQNIKKEVTDLINFLIRFSKETHIKDSLTKFKFDFEEKYGNYREVPLLEVMDPIYGIGYEGDRQQEEEFVSRKVLKNNFVKRKIIEAIKNDEDVVFTDEDVKENLKEIKEEYLPTSMELNAEIIAENINEMERGNYRLKVGGNFGSSGAGKSIGRFSDILKESKDIYSEVKSEEKKLIGSDFIQCELIALDMDPRCTNVSITNNFRDFQINISNTPADCKVPNIDIRDVYIGLENESLYLKSKKYNKKLLVTTNHMLNTLRSDKICTLLRDISDGCNALNPYALLSYIYMQDLDYIPRIMYKNTMLISKSWRLRKSDFKDQPLSYEYFWDKFQQIKEKYNIPDYIYIKNHDLLLLIDLKEDKFKEILFKEFSKDKVDYIILQEAGFENKWISNKDGYYNNEFVFQFIKDKKHDKKKNINYIFPTISKYKENKINNNKDRNFGVFSEWMYLKIYHNNYRTKEILSNEILNLIDILKEKELISKWFYIQYKDEKHHIRLRLKIKDIDKNYLDVVQEIRRFEKNIIDRGLAGKISLDSYERETERYGGEEVIDYMEDVFEAQSYTILQYLRYSNSKKISINEVEFGVVSLINLMKYLDIDYKTQLNIFTTIMDKDLKRKEFGRDRKKYISYYNKYIDGQDRDLKDNLSELLSISKNSLNTAASIINEVDLKGNLTNSKLDILLSLMHMFCNRLYGIDHKKEKNIMAFVRHTLYSVRYFKLK